MKIAITTVQAPFISGGAEFHANNLKENLIKAGHDAEIITMSLFDNPLSLIEEHIIASRLMDINHSWAGRIDLCIGLKFPAYYMPHDNKIIWALHQHRAAYDLFDTTYSSIINNPEGNKIKEIIVNADNRYLCEAKKIYANSKNVSSRMMKYNQIKSTPLYHPCPDMDEFYCGNYGDYILMPSRINMTKRQMLAIEAMRYTKSNTKLYILGRPDNKCVQQELLTKIKEYKLHNKVKYLGEVTQSEKIKLYANSKAILFIPLDEDYGYITLESMAASKAVITALDSGGPLEFVEDGMTGLIVSPTSQNIARAIDEFGYSQTMCQQYGKQAKKHLLSMNITWDNVVKELTK